MLTRVFRQSAQRGAKSRSKREDCADHQIESEQKPDEPRRPGRPIAERKPVVDVVRDSAPSSHQVGRVVSQRCDDRRGEQEWDAQSLKTIAQEGRVSLAYQRRPHEQSRYEEHQRHEIKVSLKLTKRVRSGECECESTIGNARSQHRGFEQRRSRGWHAPEIRDGGMMGEHEDDKKAAQVADRDVVSADCSMRNRLTTEVGRTRCESCS